MNDYFRIFTLLSDLIEITYYVAQFVAIIGIQQNISGILNNLFPMALSM